MEVCDRRLDGRQLNFAYTFLGLNSRLSSLVGKNGQSVLTWPPFQILKERFVFNGLLSMNSNHTKRILVLNHTIVVFYNNYSI